MECKCTLREKLVGDGCEICNTSLAIDSLPTPLELSEELQYRFSQDQAEAIAAEIYQPLLNLIKILSYKIDRVI